MTTECSVFRREHTLDKALQAIKALENRYRNISIDNLGNRYNTDLIEALELGHMLALAETVVASALARTESRGAHWREDFPERNDENWLKHTQIRKTDSGISITYKPVTITRFEPKPRAY